MTNATCVRFDRSESPEHVNEGKGWDMASSYAAMEEMGVCAVKTVRRDGAILHRLKMDRTSNLRTRSLMKGIEVWYDGS